MTPYDTAVIIAGGKSRRMGKDKALLPFGKYSSLSAFQYHKLTSYFQHVYLSAKEDKFDFDAPLIKDNDTLSSPLVAIQTLFEVLKSKEIFILSVDAPFVDEAIIHALMREDITDYDCIVAKSPHGLQPLCARYHHSIIPLLHAQCKANNHKLQDLLHKAKTRIVYFEDDEPFTNLNHPTEYQDALTRLVHR